MSTTFSEKIKGFVLFGILLCGSLQAEVINLVVNGNFETGNFLGWTTAQQNPDGSWIVYSGSFPSLGPPPEGTYAAVTNTEHVSSMVLYQDIPLPADPLEPLILKYTYYYHNDGASFASPPTLEASRFFPNQQARIDIMDPSAPEFSVAPGDVLLNLFQTQPGDPFDVPYTTVSFDLSSFAGQTIRLRFALADSLGIFAFGVDEVSIELEVISILPPRNLVGKVIKNKFLTQTDRINRLRWQPSLTPGVISYYVLRNGELIAMVPSTAPLVYEDHNRSKAKDIYSVIAISVDGDQSDPVTITLP